MSLGISAFEKILAAAGEKVYHVSDFTVNVISYIYRTWQISRKYYFEKHLCVNVVSRTLVFVNGYIKVCDSSSVSLKLSIVCGSILAVVSSFCIFVCICIAVYVMLW